MLILLSAAIVAAASPTVLAGRSAVNVICDAWPPYQIVENERIHGFSTQTVRAVFNRMGVKFLALKGYPWKRAIKMMERGEADALFSVNYTPERSRYAHYPSEPLVETPWVMWVQKESGNRFDSFEDLIGKRVGLVNGYSYTPSFWEFVKKHRLHELVASDVNNFKKLNGGNLDFVLAEKRNGAYILNQLRIDTIVPLGHNPVKTDGLYIIFSKREVSEAFVERFSNTLRKFKKEPAYQYLYRRYLVSIHK